MPDYTADELLHKPEPDSGRLVGEGANTTETPPRESPQVDRLTIIQRIIHSSKLAGTQSAAGDYERSIKTDEEAWRRERFIVGETWKKLDLGWFTMETLGLIMLRHRGTDWNVNPTDEQRQAAAAKVVHIYFQRGDSPAMGDGKGDLILYPKESQMLTPSHDGLWLRCESGEADLAVAIYPR